MLNLEYISILLADDDEDDRQLFIEAFAELKIKTMVNTVSDGMQLMNYLKQENSLLPHLLFLDLNMPCKTGVECLIEIKKNQTLKDIVIAIYSTSASEEDIEDTFVKGANVYVKKPNDFNTLKEVLFQIVSLNLQYHSSGLNRDNFLLNL